MKSKFLSLCLLCSIPPVFAETIFLSAHGLEAGISPDTGGRLVSLRWKGSGNLIDTRWEALEKAGPPEKLLWMEYFENPRGHVFWISPQSEWWIHQTRFREKKKRHSPWPPDPWLEFAKAITELFPPGKAVLTLPESPVSGIQMTKSYRIGKSAQGETVLHLTCTVRNTGKKNRALAVWSVTRVPPESVVELKTVSETDGNKRMSFQADAKTPRFKCFPIPAVPVFRIRTGKIIWRKRWESIHMPNPPGHSAAEIAYDPGPPPCLEVECHGRYRKLAPGESEIFSEEWIFQ